MKPFSWLLDRARYGINELIAPSPKDNIEFRNEPWHDEICLHRKDWAWDFAAAGETEEADLNRALAETRANDNQRQELKL